MTFTTPCFVRVENPEKRKELIEWLEWIGYKLEYLRNDGVIVLTSENRVYVYGEAVHEIIKSDYDAIDCGKNIELFKALAAMMDGPECTEQYLMATANLYVLKRGKVKQLAAKGELLHNDVIVKCGGVFSSLRKATAEEIVEYFKNKER